MTTREHAPTPTAIDPEKVRNWNQVLPPPRFKHLFLETAETLKLETYESYGFVFINANIKEIAILNAAVDRAINEARKHAQTMRQSTAVEAASAASTNNTQITIETKQPVQETAIRVLRHSVLRSLLSFFSDRQASLQDLRS